MSRIQFKVPLVPKSINQVGQHWSWRMRESEKWAEYFLEPKQMENGFKYRVKLKRQITIGIHWGKNGPLPDMDNLIAGMKPVVDTLKKMGFIWDDSPEWVTINYLPVERSKKSWTEFTVEDL